MEKMFQQILNITKLNAVHNARNFSNLPRRALMYVPGSDERKLGKAFKLDVDCIVMDCEDGVASNKKAHARETLQKILQNPKPMKNREYDLGFRVNDISTEYFVHDIKAALTNPTIPDTIVLPKVNSIEQVKVFAAEVSKYPNRGFNLVMLIESAMAVLNVTEIIKVAFDEGKKVNFNPAGLIFGGDDYLADVGARKSSDCGELIYARQKIVAAAKAYKMQAIDVVHIQYKDLESLKRQSEQGAAFGFTGKQVIHPDQVPIVQRAFLPTVAQYTWAKGVLEAFEAHEKSGKGAFTYNNAMIDLPTVKQANNIVELYKLEGK